MDLNLLPVKSLIIEKCRILVMPNFLDSNLFGQLLVGVDREHLPPEILSETFLSPVTALEVAQHPRKLHIMREHRGHLRPMRNRFIARPEGYDDFLNSLESRPARYFRAQLDAMHTSWVMYPRFLEFHLSRYGKHPPKGIGSSKRLNSDVRDSMQLIFSQQVPFITNDSDLSKKLSPLMNCQVIHCDSEPNCVVSAMRLVNMNLTTGEKMAQL
jgi:hypothetical protein